jgi:hypothetical protein
MKKPAKGRLFLRPRKRYFLVSVVVVVVDGVVVVPDGVVVVVLDGAVVVVVVLDVPVAGAAAGASAGFGASTFTSTFGAGGGAVSVFWQPAATAAAARATRRWAFIVRVPSIMFLG